MSGRSFPDRQASRRSSALIITLAALVLVSGLVLLLFNQSSMNRMISYSSAGQYRADLAAHAAIDTITGDLRDEITAGSTLTPVSGGTNLYIPTSSFTVVPSRVEDQGFTNLVAQSSSSSNFWSGSSYAATPISPVRSAPANSTQSRSFNGRYIDPSEWNEAGLLGDPGSAAVPNVPANYTPPDWVVITRRGPMANATTSMPSISNLANHNQANLDYAVGRYAYTIYDEGSLMDVTVAGLPQSLQGSSFATARGLLPHVDLANLLAAAPISDPSAAADASALVAWRNQATASSASFYTNYVSNTTNGFAAVAATGSQFTRVSDGTTFTVPAPGDQTFLGRRDLINYVKSNSSIPTAALPYLGTSTLDSDQPSYYPDPNRPKVSAQDDVTNPKVATIRVQNGFTRPDGVTPAGVGEPLLKHRFPLSRLALFNNPTGGNNAALIKKYFCMQARSDGLWDYVDPDTGAVKAIMPPIKTLAQVAAASPGREPTFWELLQAGILTGSLGVEFTGSGVVAGHIVDQNQNTARQIFEIGLSIIDQYDADDNPTVINFGGSVLTPEPTVSTSTQASNALKMSVAGVENLPYITWIAQQFCRDNITVATPSSNAYIDGYLMFGLWNPHRNFAAGTQGAYRILVNGTTAIQVNNTATLNNGVGAYNVNSPQITHSTVIQFHASGTRFSQMDVLRPSDAQGSDLAQTTADGVFPYGSGSGAKQLGLCLGSVNVPKTPDINSSPPTGSLTFMDPLYLSSAVVPNVTAISIVLERQVGANWIPYQVIPYLQKYQGYSGIDFAQITAQMNAGTFEANNGDVPMIVAYAHSDPRTNRFGLALASGAQTPLMNANDFNLITASGAPIPFLTMGAPLTSPPFSGSTVSVADYAYNQTGDSASYYTDRDGVVRKGDPNPSSAATHNVVDSPYYSAATAGNSADGRPVMLNRPFDSVADMGYAFRDDPWRSLNFSSSDSADAGLLDLFSVNETEANNRAGVVNVNSASPEVLAAILQNAYRDPSVSDQAPLTAAQAATIAQAVRAQLGSRSAPSFVLGNPADLATLCQKVASSLPDNFKFKREAFTRSFADVINTRTWNLLIDVVAQSGRYSPQAKTLNDFTVEGERRYWVHVAIDRLTGQILSTQTELVTQ